MLQNKIGHWEFIITKRKEGSWRGGWWKCSICKGCTSEEGFPSISEYCPNCGAHLIDTPQLVKREQKEIN